VIGWSHRVGLLSSLGCVLEVERLAALLPVLYHSM